MTVWAPSGPPPRGTRGLSRPPSWSPQPPPQASFVRGLGPLRQHRKRPPSPVPRGKGCGEIEWAASGQCRTLIFTPTAFREGGVGGAQRLHLWEILPREGLEVAASSCGDLCGQRCPLPTFVLSLPGCRSGDGRTVKANSPGPQAWPGLQGFCGNVGCTGRGGPSTDVTGVGTTERGPTKGGSGSSGTLASLPRQSPFIFTAVGPGPSFLLHPAASGM